MRKLLLLLLAYFPLLALGQNLTTQSVRETIENYNTQYQQEKAYLQFDKPVYAPGETVWFKAYFMAGIDPVSFSTTMYFDFADANGRILKHVVSPVVQGSSSGSFVIPANYTGASIQLKAYTKWMLNFDSAFLYSKSIRVIQQQNKQANTKPPVTDNRISVQFFPESGDCIAELNAKIAFKAVYSDGRPYDIRGNIVNTKGETVADIKTIHDGMGYFMLDAKKGETYSAKWKDDQGKVVITPLPAVKDEGISLEVHINDVKRNFIIRRSDNAPASMNKINIIGTMSGQLVYMASVNLGSTRVIGGSIPVDQFPSGILQITLLDSNWTAVAERITFINNNDYSFEPEVGFATLATGKRGKNVLVVNVPDTVDANLSIAVTDAGIGIDSSGNIISHLLLTSDIKGTVYQPAYYFRDNSDTLQKQLDLVMLTNGWRRIKWEDVIKGKLPKLQYPSPDTAYLCVAGKIYGASSLDMKQSAMLFLILDHPSDTTRQAIQTTIRPDGTFREPGIVLFDTTKVYYQFIGNKDLVNSSEVSLNNGMLTAMPKVSAGSNWLYPDSAADARNRYFALQEAMLQKLLAGTTLEGVTVTAKTKSPAQVLDDKYTTGLFNGGNARQFDVASDPTSPAQMSVLTYLQGKVAGLQIYTGGQPGSSGSVTWRGGTPNFYLDEMPVDINQLTNTPMTTIAYVKVFQPPFFGPGSGGASGAIAVYTKRGGSEPAAKGKGMPFKVMIGYTVQKEFYSPNYGTFDQRNNWEDQRSTLYWNPSIYTTPKNHLIRLPFYNNDITNSFRIILEGVNKDGKLTHIEKIIE